MIQQYIKGDNMSLKEIEAYKNNTKVITFNVQDENGVIFPLPDFEMYFTVKNNFDDLDADIIISKTAVIADASTGQGVVTLLPADTNIDVKKYVYDVRIENATTGEEYTVAVDDFEILNIVKRS